ncbi:putative MFS family arabinose efflux permease [Tahibacter aquaticus]|uniref:Putative MFS family arabinose efflux permease n=1 Tax=Tahibacter aquaticus TaxID=520092 RepID=A0A4R6Z710_9GAMM|nr:MFS transporter [Tahibacter aquaticus]TDR47545.1 putative MFS family arabinose efflux permease [Tahibacter aquaticus]
MASVPQGTAVPGSAPLTQGHKRVIFASSLGTVFEWYDFYLYGSLAAIIAKQFFTALSPTSGFIFALLAFAAGFAVRPFGALVFGRLGDLIGRKYTFLVTIVIMGLSTFLVGILPSYASIGIAAPVILITLRLLQGLALGGEYGGAATYVAEHAPPGKRGLYTSFIQTTATLGLFLSLLVILGCRTWLGTEEFDKWGWRIPFLLSVVLLGISVWIRLQLNESPLFQQMKAEGKGSKAPITESFFSSNGKIALLALLGATAGQAVVWYAGQFYALFFLTQTLKIDATTANLLMAGALAAATPFFVVFGWLSDKIGRKPIIMAGCLIAALTYFPIFKALTHYGNPALEAASQTSPVTVLADPAQCAFQFVPGELKSHVTFRSSCDIVKGYLAGKNIPYVNEAAPAGTLASVKIGTTTIPSFDGAGLNADQFKAQSTTFTDAMAAATKAAGYPDKADPTQINRFMVFILLTILVFYVTMVYGPIAAWLVELFPTRIRYTSMSLPYHIGNGWFGGFLPTTAFALVAATGNIYQGLWYPIVIALFTFVVGSLFLRETKDVDISK